VPDAEFEEWRQQHELLLATVPAVKVVGLQHYRGIVHRGEWANLVRDPRNPYDSNAIKVTTLSGSVQVGHINRYSAATLRSTLDDRSRSRVRVDCDFPSAGSNSRVYTVQARLRFWGFRHQSASLLSRIRGLRPRTGPGLGWTRHTPGSAATAAGATAAAVKKIKFDPVQAHKELDALFDKLAADRAKMDEYDAPAAVGSTLKARLFPHQKKGVHWMLAREESDPTGLPPFWSREGSKYLNSITNSTSNTCPKKVRGGVLADDMGLGKTLQTIAVIVHDLVADGFIEAVPFDPEAEASEPAIEFRTLKVKRLKALCKSRGLAVSGKKADLIARLEGAASGGANSSVSSAVVDLSGPSPPSSSSSSSSSSADRGAVRKSKRRATLVVAPASVVSTWASQIAKFAPTLSVEVYHGPNRNSDPVHLAQLDVVVTSYGVVKSECGGDAGKKRKNAGAGAAASTTGVHAVMWRRVVLDEAHEIRNRKTRSAKAVKQLSARFRWCLTGTPLQNQASDIQSLFEFLKLSPLSNHGIFHRAVTRPIRVGDKTGLARLRTTLKSICLRRTKRILGSMLPSKTITIHSLDLASFTGAAASAAAEAAPTPQWDAYNALADSAAAVFRAVIEGGGRDAVMRNYSQVLEMILRLRQAACCLDMVPGERIRAARDLLAQLQSSSSSSSCESNKQLTAEEATALFQKLKGILDIDEGQSSAPDVDAKDRECAVCLEELAPASARILRGCGHCFCQACLHGVIKTAPASTGPRCPLCRGSFSGGDIVSVEELAAAGEVPGVASEGDDDVAMPDQADATSASAKSVKIVALVEHLARTRADDPGRKCVVFSHFTSFLDRIGTELAALEQPFGCVSIRGGMTVAARARAMKTFEADPDTTVMLVSTRAGGVGINLTRASLVFMMDPWWNFSVEAQAIDRVHRIGQTRAVEVVRYICAGTIEERILEIQKRKDAVAAGAMGKLTPEQARNARFDDVQSMLTRPIH
jgi:SWI/SNF-related matrix-associated actin-dependent regulator of chromatin subfamily A3